MNYQYNDCCPIYITDNNKISNKENVLPNEGTGTSIITVVVDDAPVTDPPNVDAVEEGGVSGDDEYDLNDELREVLGKKFPQQMHQSS